MQQITLRDEIVLLTCNKTLVILIKTCCCRPHSHRAPGKAVFVCVTLITPCRTLSHISSAFAAAAIGITWSIYFVLILLFSQLRWGPQQVQGHFYSGTGPCRPPCRIATGFNDGPGAAPTRQRQIMQILVLSFWTTAGTTLIRHFLSYWHIFENHIIGEHDVSIHNIGLWPSHWAGACWGVCLNICNEQQRCYPTCVCHAGLH